MEMKVNKMLLFTAFVLLFALSTVESSDPLEECQKTLHSIPLDFEDDTGNNLLMALKIISLKPCNDKRFDRDSSKE